MRGRMRLWGGSATGLGEFEPFAVLVKLLHRGEGQSVNLVNEQVFHGVSLSSSDHRERGLGSRQTIG